MLRSNFKSLIEAATGVPVAQQKLFFGPWGILEDNRKALEGEPGMRFFFNQMAMWKEGHLWYLMINQWILGYFRVPYF